MPFIVEDNKVIFHFCSDNHCILKKYDDRRDEITLEFAGASKSCTRGIKVDDSFIVQNEAESWDGNHHDFGITIDRRNVVKNHTVLKIVRSIQNDNLLMIRDYCQCCVELEYVDGYILNTRKGSWILGEHAYEEDYLDVCSPRQFIGLTQKILNTLKLLHQHGICHTDVMDHNIMVRKKDDVPILIDLIGMMPYSKELEELDNRVFLEHVVIDGLARLGIKVPNNIELLKKSNGDYCLDVLEGYLSDLEDLYI